MDNKNIRKVLYRDKIVIYFIASSGFCTVKKFKITSSEEGNKKEEAMLFYIIDRPMIMETRMKTHFYKYFQSICRNLC